MVAVLIDTPHSPQADRADRAGRVRPHAAAGPLRLAGAPVLHDVAAPNTPRSNTPRSSEMRSREVRSNEMMYLRRRVVAAAVALVALFAMVWIAEALVAAVIPEVATSAPTVVETASAEGLMVADADGVIVQPGDTLWSIARAVQPEGDVRPLVQRLAELNGGAQIRAGQALVLP